MTSSSTSSRARLIRAVAHDIRTPLGVLTAAHGQLATKLDGSEIETRMLEMAQRAVAQLAHLADRLTLSARVEQGALGGAEPSRVALADVVRDAVATVQRSRRRRGVTVEVEAGPAVEVEGDRAELAAAVAEIVDNGLRFAESEVRVKPSLEGDLARVIVEDDGRGFDEAAQARFGTETPGGTGGGLGIGTSIAKAIVESRGGSLRIERPNGPTTVVLEIRRATP